MDPAVAGRFSPFSFSWPLASMNKKNSRKEKGGGDRKFGEKYLVICAPL